MTDTNSIAHDIIEEEDTPKQADDATAPLQLIAKLGSLYETLSRVQNEHGVYPFNDYNQYGKYCSQRLSRIRHNPMVKSYLLHNHKYHSVLGEVSTVSNNRSQPNRRKHAYYSRRTVYDNLPSVIHSDTNPTTYEHFVWNIFFQSERAWAQASALLQPAADRKSRHGHVQRRFNKAYYWSRVLYQTAQTLLLSPEPVGSIDLNANGVFLQECHSYMKWMEGNAALEHKNYTKAFLAYRESMTILHRLLAHAASAAPDPSWNHDHCCAIWNQRIDNVLRPLVRYCQYEAKDDSLVLLEDVTELDSAAVASSSSSSSSAIVIPFRGTDIVLDHDSYSQQITVLYLKLEPQLLLLRKSDMDIFQDETICLQVISDIDDTMTGVMDEIKSLVQAKMNADAAASAVARKRAQLMTFYSFLKYHKLSIWRRQQEQRIALTVKPYDNRENNESIRIGEILRLYTSLQQIAVSMTDLAPPLDSFPDHATAALDPSTNYDDDPYILEAQTHIVRARAFRSYYLARYYEIMGQPAKYSNSHSVVQQYSLPLLQHALVLTKRAMEELSACSDEATLLLSAELVDSYNQELEELDFQIKAMRCRIEATLYLQQFPLTDQTSTSSWTSQKPLVDPERPLWLRYAEDEDACEGNVLADEPPLPIPMPCKGVFYDISYQYLEDFILSDVVPSLHERCLVATNSFAAPTSTAETSKSALSVLQWFGKK
jgi:RNA-binding signal recognition particle 68